MKELIEKNEFFEINFDSSRRRIYLELKGFWMDATVDAYLAAQDRLIKKLPSSFTLLADMRGYKTLPQHLIPKQMKSIETLFKLGLYRAANIDPQSIIAKLQLNKIVNDANEPIWMFKTPEEGEAWLDAEERKRK